MSVHREGWYPWPALQVVSQHALQHVSRGGAWSRGGGGVPGLGGVPGPGGAWSGGGDPSPHQQMATVADGTHPTGMHSCFTGSLSVRGWGGGGR